MGIYYFKKYLLREMKVKKAVSGGDPVATHTDRGPYNTVLHETFVNVTMI